MNISTNIKYFAVALVAAASLCSCNDIDEDDRYIELPVIEAKRVVLLEEFTGQKCVNCPAAHEVVTQLLKDYPDGLISVSIHGGGDAFSFSEEVMRQQGLRVAEGQAYCDSYNVAELPAGVVNRKTGVLKSSQWAKEIRDELVKPSNINLDLKTELAEDGKTLNVTCEIMPYEAYKGFLQLWVVESGITAIQYLEGNKIDRNYVHNHVFRGSVNGHDGEAITLVPREPATLSYTVTVRDDDNAKWNVDNLSIVGFIYNSQGVYQAVQAHVKTN